MNKLFESMAVSAGTRQERSLKKRKTLPNLLPSDLRLSPTRTSTAPPLTPTRGPKSPPARRSSATERRSQSRATLFSASPDGPGSRATSASTPRATRKFLYSLAVISMSRRTSGDTPQSKLGRRDSGSSRLAGLAAAVRQSRPSLGAFGTMGSVTNMVTLRRRALLKLKLTKSQLMWKKLRVWVPIIYVLKKLLDKHASQAMTDPSSPFYSHKGEMDDPAAGIDKDHYMFFDPSHFKANRQMRMSQEAKRILTKPPEERTAEEIHFAMIGLRGLPIIAEYPVRMQRNLAQYGRFECFDAKRVIVKQGRRPEGFYFVLYGSGTGHHEQGNTQLAYEKIFMTGENRSLNDPDQYDFLSSMPFMRGWPVKKLFENPDPKNVTFGYFPRKSVLVKDSNFSDWLILGSATVLKKLVRTNPTVSKRTGQYTDTSTTTGFFTFLSSDTDYNRWLNNRNITLPPPLTISDSDTDMETDWPSTMHRARPLTSVGGTEQQTVKGIRKTRSAFRSGAKASVSFARKASILRRPKIQFGPDTNSELTDEVKFAATKRTFLDDLDAGFRARAHILTEADINPQFVYVHTLTKGDVFGLAPLVFPDQPSLCLISNGAECLMIKKKFYLDNCPQGLAQRLKVEVSPYPSEKKLQQDLVNRINWDVYKNAITRHVYEYSRVTVTPL
ncbi:hypothetical protein BaRGS_00005281 [Batillaria attramentaria]|uniref:Cyclic nucleotide-binding domain-containing protein n=1 Tax=Batillaria attramentaria TaxID=370345 RepID=A0ABD0LUN3_9CAEN